MSSVYTGVGGNVSQSTSPTITVPSDGDSLAVTSVNVAMDKLMDYIALLFGGAQTGQTSSTPGYAGTGGASAQGLKATAGGGSSPVKGMINLVPTTNAPSSSDNGDLWVTTAGIFGAKVNGNIRTVGLLEAAQTWTGVQTGANFAKAWAYLQCSTAGAVTVNSGFNVTSASYATNALTVTITNAFADTSTVVLCVHGASNSYRVLPPLPINSTTSIVFTKYNAFDATLQNWATSETMSFIAFR